MSQNKKFDFTVACAVFLLVIVGAFVYKAVPTILKGREDRAKATTAVALLQAATQAFSEKDKATQEEWARGELKDPWGNGIKLHSKDRQVFFSSNGPDGIEDTEDDIRCSPLLYVATKIPKEQVADRPQNVPDKPKKVWRFEWKWGRSLQEKDNNG